MNDNNSQGRHRTVAVATRSTVVAAAAVSVAVAFTGHALADDVQPGLSTTTPQQPGLSTTTPAPAPATEPEGGYIDGFTPRYDYGGQTRTVEDYNAGRQTPSYQSEPVYYDSAPAPVQGPGIEAETETTTPAPAPAPAPTVKKTKIVPIQTPENTVLVGADVIPTPYGVDPVFARQVSNTFSALAADGGNLLVDNGLADAPRADRIAVGTAGGAVTGGLVGLGAGLVPGTAITAGGAAIGAGLGVAATPLLTPAVVAVGPGLFVFVPGAAALAGAGVGAAISAPIVATTTVIGAVTGGLIGGAAAGGEAITVEEPAPAAAPAIETLPVGPSADQLPIIPASLTTSPSPDLLAQASTAVENAAPVVQQAISDTDAWTAPARTAVEGFTSTVLEQPTVADAAAAAGPALGQVADVVTGALAGLGVARV
ncbi:hypothetical protein DK926_19375 [Rhodococcus sp. Eu-32]|uniref:hypothetical protein n=1 Tax=Rhodococcus sp. Eu-32 TaxID=1017319 RepID=UPI000F79AE82|nr:hypothetical protein [Rhodococcus sp. Eu-32]RRQ26162.1 hypothetical protein DK926_19375 [Rhodococcus sp. Eu-32]